MKTITYKGETKTIGAWSREKKVSYYTLYERIHVYGMTVAEAINKPVQKLITHQGETKTIKEWSKKKRIKYNTLHRRIFRYNFTIEDALNK